MLVKGKRLLSLILLNGSFASAIKENDNSLCYNAGTRQYNGQDANVYYWRWLNSSTSPERGAKTSKRTRLLKQ